MTDPVTFVSPYNNLTVSLDDQRETVLYEGTPVPMIQPVASASFTDGKFTTRNELQIKALRENHHNKANGGTLFSEVGGNVEEAVKTAKEVDDELPPTKKTGEAELEPTQIIEQEGGAKKIYEQVETVADAVKVLTRHPYELPEPALYGGNNQPAKTPVLKFASDLGVVFPNL